MKKLVFYIPAILLAIIFGWLATSFRIDPISPIVLVWMTLFLVSGFLLNNNRAFGGVLGMLPGIHMIYMSTKDTGQIINIELPFGIIILIFYLVCSVSVRYKIK
ncbi:hypothetical protein [Gudongella sp. DL1XJH-153]|uniref:hypothetical protein n=1 Tax=Gudongella sp. DL1XJH-153 TaxID=3409804 RepID=UPI003BB75B0D